MLKTFSFIFIITQILFTELNLSPKEESIRPQKDYAVFFAVNDYDKLKPLKNPILNANSIAKTLEEKYEFRTEVFENATLEEIEKTLFEYEKIFKEEKFNSEGQLIIYFSGHGITEYENGFFLPKDADPDNLRKTAISYEYWRPFIDQINCQHILVIIDACYSVRFDPKWETRGGPGFMRPGELNEEERMIYDHTQSKSRFLITSDGNEEETPDQSDFAKKLHEALILGSRSRSILTSSEIFSYLEFARPHPHGNGFGSDMPQSSFLFFDSDPNYNEDLKKILEKKYKRTQQKSRDLPVSISVKHSDVQFFESDSCKEKKVGNLLIINNLGFEINFSAYPIEQDYYYYESELSFTINPGGTKNLFKKSSGPYSYTITKKRNKVLKNFLFGDMQLEENEFYIPTCDTDTLILEN